MPKKPDPELDGVDHINIYSKGKTELGRLLSNFAHTPFEHPRYGHFESVEGFWYWVSTSHPDRDELRRLHGYLAKKVGREFGGKDWTELMTFKTDVLNALKAKLEQTPRLQELLGTSDLPFKHYYVYGDKVVEPKEGKWMLDFWGQARWQMKNG